MTNPPDPDFDPEEFKYNDAAMRGHPLEPTPYYTWSSYVNPDFAENEYIKEDGTIVPADPGTIYVGQWGVCIGGMVISMVNGCMAANPIDQPAISINFDEYMPDYFAANVTPARILNDIEQGLPPAFIVEWDPQAERYKPAGFDDDRVRHWHRPFDPD